MANISFSSWTLSKNESSVLIMTLSNHTNFAGVMAIMSSEGVHSSGQVPYGSTLLRANLKMDTLKFCGWSLLDHTNSIGQNISEYELNLMILNQIKTYSCNESFWAQIKRGFKRVGVDIDSVESSIVYADMYGAW